MFTIMLFIVFSDEIGGEKSTMKLIYKGKFDGNPDSLPAGEHKPNFHAFKEISDIKKFSSVMNLLALIGIAILYVVFGLISGFKNFNIYGWLLALISMFPHELLHAICFKEEVYLYTNFKMGILFVTGTETMSKLRFIIMSLLPNIIFGFIPFALYLINPELTLLGSVAVFTIPMGLGDYYNVMNALIQMPKGSRTYLYKTQSYWYMPE